MEQAEFSLQTTTLQKHAFYRTTIINTLHEVISNGSYMQGVLFLCS